MRNCEIVANRDKTIARQNPLVPTRIVRFRCVPDYRDGRPLKRDLRGARLN
jgi:hypothetical protein